MSGTTSTQYTVSKGPVAFITGGILAACYLPTDYRLLTSPGGLVLEGVNLRVNRRYSWL